MFEVRFSAKLSIGFLIMCNILISLIYWVKKIS